MAFAFIQSRSTSGADPRTLAYTGAVAAGSLLVCSVFWNDAAATMAVSDDRNGAWTAISSPKTGLSSLAAWRLQSFYFAGAVAGTTTVTANASSATGVTVGLAIHEYSFGATPSVDDAIYDAVDNPAANPFVTTAITKSQAGDLLYGADLFQNAQGGTPTMGGVSTAVRETTNWGNNITCDRVDGGAAASITAAFPASGAGEDQITNFVAFKEAAAAAAAGRLGSSSALSAVGF